MKNAKPPAPQELKPPIFCPDCRKPEIFKRIPEKDIISDSGKIMWERWSCPSCPYETILPIKENI
jgi:hypothetical protein